MEDIKFYKRPKLQDPYLIVAWPGMGEVAYKAADYLIKELKAECFAEIAPEDFFYITGAVIEKGLLRAPPLPSSKFYYWTNPNRKIRRDLIIFISNAQPDLAKAALYSKKIIDLGKAFKIKMVITFAAMPLAIDHTQESQVWVTATNEALKGKLKNFGLKLLLEGQISGMNGLFLGLAKQEGLDGFCLLGEIPLYTIQIENPKATHAVLDVLAKILNIQLNFNHLVKEEEMMQEEINKLLEFLKLGPPSPGPIGEEEIEKIKKSLSQLTKLPLSVKNKIEGLFNKAKIDIKSANELKLELDKWSVYKEYEDRFLDLFKKSKEKSN